MSVEVESSIESSIANIVFGRRMVCFLNNPAERRRESHRPEIFRGVGRPTSPSSAQKFCCGCMREGHSYAIWLLQGLRKDQEGCGINASSLGGKAPNAEVQEVIMNFWAYCPPTSRLTSVVHLLYILTIILWGCNVLNHIHGSSSTSCEYLLRAVSESLPSIYL